MAFTLDQVELVSLLVEAVLYGLYIFLFSCTVYVLVYKRSTRRIAYGMLGLSVLLFALATAHLITNFVRLQEAFSLAQHSPGAAAVVLGNQTEFKNILKDSLLLAEILIGDVLLIYRCYIAWGGSLRILILPLVVLTGMAASSIGLVYSLRNMHPDSLDVSASRRLQSFIIGTEVLVLMNNVICTSLIAWKLWYMSRAMVSRAQRQSLRGVARIFVESGLIIALSWLLFIILNAARLTAQVIILDALAPLTGGSYCLLVSRVARGLDSDGDGAGAPAGTQQVYECAGPASPLVTAISPVLDGTSRPHRAVEISVSSRQSVRVETEMDVLYQDKKARLALPLPLP